MVSLWLFFLDPSVSQPVSVRRESMEANLVAPVTFSKSFGSYCVQFFHTTSAYSRSGRINEKKIV